MSTSQQSNANLEGHNKLAGSRSSPMKRARRRRHPRLIEKDSDHSFVSEPSLSGGDDDNGNEKSESAPPPPPPPPPPPGTSFIPPLTAQHNSQQTFRSSSPGNTSLSSRESPHVQKQIELLFAERKPSRNRTSGENHPSTGINPPVPQFFSQPALHLPKPFQHNHHEHEGRFQRHNDNNIFLSSRSTSSTSLGQMGRAAEFLQDLKVQSVGALQNAGPDDFDSDRSRLGHMNSAELDKVIRPKANPTAITAMNRNNNQTTKQAAQSATEVKESFDFNLSESEVETSKDKPESVSTKDSEAASALLFDVVGQKGQQHSADDEDFPKRARRRRNPSAPKSARGPGHRRTRSGDQTAANLITGGTDWIGMLENQLPIPKESGSDDFVGLPTARRKTTDSASRRTNSGSDMSLFDLSDNTPSVAKSSGRSRAHRRSRSAGQVPAKIIIAGTGSSDKLENQFSIPKQNDHDDSGALPSKPISPKNPDSVRRRKNSESEMSLLESSDNPPSVARSSSKSRGHRRNRSGDQAAANLITGGTDWIGMLENQLPIPKMDEEDDIAPLPIKPKKTDNVIRLKKKGDGYSESELSMFESSDDGFVMGRVSKPGKYRRGGSSGKKQRRRTSLVRGSSSGKITQTPDKTVLDSVVVSEVPDSPALRQRFSFKSRSHIFSSHSNIVSSDAENDPISPVKGDGQLSSFESPGAKDTRGPLSGLKSRVRGMLKVIHSMGSQDSGFSWISTKSAKEPKSPKLVTRLSESFSKTEVDTSKVRESSAKTSDDSRKSEVIKPPRPLGKKLTRKSSQLEMSPTRFSGLRQLGFLGGTGSFRPVTTHIDDTDKEHPTFICPNCGTKQREFFSVASAPSQYEPSLGHSLYLASFAVVSLFVLGFQMGLSPVNSVYFSVITLTTVGFGDIVPKTNLSKIVDCIFIYVGLLSIGLLFGAYLTYFLDRDSRKQAERTRVLNCVVCCEAHDKEELAKAQAKAKKNRPSSSSTLGFASTLSQRLLDISDRGGKRAKLSHEEKMKDESSRSLPAHLSERNVIAPAPLIYTKSGGRLGIPMAGRFTRHSSLAVNFPESKSTTSKEVSNFPSMNDSSIHHSMRTAPQSGNDDSDDEDSTGSLGSLISQDTDFRKPPSRMKTIKYIFNTLKTSVLTCIMIIICGAVAFHYIEGYSAVNSFYFTTVLLTTVGYGDLTPKTDFGKIFCTIYVLLGGTVLVSNLTLISSIPVELRRRRIARSVLTQFGDQLDDGALRELATGRLVRRLNLAMDRPDGLDQCTREMFALAMLVRLGKVTESDIRQTFYAFKRLDVDNEGVLTSKTIIAGMVDKYRLKSTPPSPITGSRKRRKGSESPAVSSSPSLRFRSKFWFGEQGSLHVKTKDSNFHFTDPQLETPAESTEKSALLGGARNRRRSGTFVPLDEEGNGARWP